MELSLRKQLPDEYGVILIDREINHVFAPSLLWLMTGNRAAERISRPLSRLKRKGIEFIQGEIEQIDAQNHVVFVNGKKIASEYMIVSLGAALTPEEIPGLETGYSFYDLKETNRLKQKMLEFQKGHVVVVTASPVYKCPAAPYEAVMLIHAFFEKRGIRPQVRMSFYAAEPAPLSVAGPNVSKTVQQMLQEREISYYPQHQIIEVDPNGCELHFANGAHDSYDLLIYVAPHKPPRVVKDSGLVDEIGSNKAGFARGNFYASPTPMVKAYQPSIRWHLGKIVFEKIWFRTWF